VNRYERDPRARAECLKIHGSACCVCGFNFGTTYGSVGSGFIFVHHRVPVAARARDAQYELDPGRDLVAICGNCHAIVHRAQITEDYSLGQIGLSKEAWARLLELNHLISDSEWD
jgi:predicted HNH restriction endonuclease